MSDVPSAGWREVYAACGVTAPDSVSVDVEPSESRVRIIYVAGGPVAVV
jgi:hypothetical protein